MFTKDLLNELSYVQLIAGGVRTATVTGTGKDLTGYVGEVVVSLDCPNATAGTSPTMNVKIQDSADNSTFADISPAVAFVAVTDVSAAATLFQQITFDTRLVRQYVRAVATIGGTSTPSFPSVGVTMIGSKQAINLVA